MRWNYHGGKSRDEAATVQSSLSFDGATLVPALDRERLMGQLAHVLALMSDGKWRTLREIADAPNKAYSDAGVSARLRDLRKPRFGGYTVERRRVSDSGLFEYRVTK